MQSSTSEISSQQIYNLVTAGMRRKIVQTGGSGSLGVTIPKNELRKRGLKRGDEIVIVPGADGDTLELHFPPDDA